MESLAIRQIAEQILKETVLMNWKFYLIILALMLISTAASTFITNYIRKRAETFATRADLQELLDQLRATTSAAEEVRTAISHTDWAAREWKALRRAKLEELLTSAYAIKDWLDSDMNARFFSGQKPGPSPNSRLETLSRLYFPELTQETLTLTNVYYQYTQWMIGVQANLVRAGNDLVARDRVLQQELIANLNQHHGPLLQATAALEQRAPALMREIAGV